MFLHNLMDGLPESHMRQARVRGPTFAVPGTLIHLDPRKLEHSLVRQELRMQGVIVGTTFHVIVFICSHYFFISYVISLAFPFQQGDTIQLFCPECPEEFPVNRCQAGPIIHKLIPS